MFPVLGLCPYKCHLTHMSSVGRDRLAHFVVQHDALDTGRRSEHNDDRGRFSRVTSLLGVEVINKGKVLGEEEYLLL